MAQVVVRTSRYAILADVTSGYTLAFVLNLFLPLSSVRNSIRDPITEAVQIGVLGGLLSSFILIVDPMNKIVRLLFLNRSLIRHRGDQDRKWFFDILTIWEDNIRTLNFLKENSRIKARGAYNSPYLAKLRAQVSGGAVFAFTMFLFALWLLTIGQSDASFAIGAILFHSSFVIGALLILLGFVTVYSLIRDVAWRVPEFCWTVGVYELLIEFEGGDKIDRLMLIRKHFLDANLEEARSWLIYELFKDRPRRVPPLVEEPKVE